MNSLEAEATVMCGGCYAEVTHTDDDLRTKIVHRPNNTHAAAHFMAALALNNGCNTVEVRVHGCKHL